MNNDYMNDEMEIDLIELLKHLLRNIKTILVVTLVCGLITFGVTQFILPKSYISSTDITIMPQGELLDYTLSIPLSEVHAICYRSPHNPLKKSIFFKS